ncbi:MAG: matrixin family metalloprotease [Phycisphaerae bacterium]
MADITDGGQPEVMAFLSGQLGQAVRPVDYLSLRLYQLGPLAAGEVVQVEPVGDVVARVSLYDHDYTFIPGGSTRDFDGQPRVLQVPITRDIASACLRLDLSFLSERNASIARLRRLQSAASPAPRQQAVVAHFAGQDEVIFRNGLIAPLRIGPLDDPVVRSTAIEEFRAVYAPFNLIVLTDEDPPPAGPFSVLDIGPSDLSLFSYGLAEICDSRNTCQDDVAVIDANQPALKLARLFGRVAYGRALGMIAAHEMGHLLGLEHVADADDLMTGAQCQGAGLNVERMLTRQLKRSPLILVSADLQPWVLGYQDAAAYLMEILGPAPNLRVHE